MKIELNQKNKNYHFEAINESGNILNLDASINFGGENMGFLPMETVLAALGGCSVIDILSILKKQKQTIDDVKIIIESTRVDAIPSIFETINLHFVIVGKVDEKKIKKAILLTKEKYCSVYHIMRETASINYSFEIITS